MRDSHDDHSWLAPTQVLTLPADFEPMLPPERPASSKNLPQAASPIFNNSTRPSTMNSAPQSQSFSNYGGAMPGSVGAMPGSMQSYPPMPVSSTQTLGSSLNMAVPSSLAGSAHMRSQPFPPAWSSSGALPTPSSAWNLDRRAMPGSQSWPMTIPPTMPGAGYGSQPYATGSLTIPNTQVPFASMSGGAPPRVMTSMSQIPQQLTEDSMNSSFGSGLVPAQFGSSHAGIMTGPMMTGFHGSPGTHHGMTGFGSQPFGSGQMSGFGSQAFGSGQVRPLASNRVLPVSSSLI